jgi:outer membrane protein
MKRVFLVGFALATVTLNAVAAPNSPRQAGDIFVRGGAYEIFPDSSANAAVEVDDALGFGFTVGYMFADQFAVELLAAMPFQHDINLKANGAKVADVQHLPPTLSVQWMPALNSRFKPYLGVGVNLTLFFDETLNTLVLEQSLGADYTKLDVDTVSLGWSGQAGLDFFLTDTLLMNLDIRYIAISTEAKLQGSLSGAADLSLGDVDIDPWVVGINFGWQF